MNWKEPDMFLPGEHGNKPFAIRVPALVVTRGAKDRINFLTAMWFTPSGFEPSRMIVVVQKKTFSYHLLLERGEFVLSAPSARMMDVVVFAGAISGRDVDKWKAAGLTPVKPLKGSVPLIGEAIGNVEYRVVQHLPFDEESDLFVGEVLATHIRKGAMKGELYRQGSNPLLYMGTQYDAKGKSMGKYYTHLGRITRTNYESPLLKKYLRKSDHRAKKSLRRGVQETDE